MARTVSLRAGPLDGARYKTSPGEVSLPGCRLTVSYLRIGENLEIAGRRTAVYLVCGCGKAADYVQGTDKPERKGVRRASS